MRSLLLLVSRALLGAMLFLGIANPARAAWGPNPDDALLLDARLGQYRLGDGVRGYATPAGACLDLADTIMALDLPIRLDKKLRRATGWAFDESRTIRIDREAGIVQIMNKQSALAQSDIYDAPEGWCVDAAKLSQWLGVTLNADQSGALLLVKAPVKLPLEMALERRARAAKIPAQRTFDLKDLPRAAAPMRGYALPSLDVTVTASALKGGSRVPGRHAFSYEAYAAGELGPVAYNARLASSRHGRPESLRLQAYRSDPDGGLLGPLGATHVAAGDVASLSTPVAVQSSAGRGAMLTNRPLQRADSFDTTDFRGALPAGWDAELYRNSQLLAFASDRGDGRYEFLDVPLLYGQNRFEIILYGPQGQIRREERTVSVGLDSIPPRKTYYWAGISQNGRDLIGIGPRLRTFNQGWRGSFGLERGLNAMTSISAFAHSFVIDDGKRRNQAELALRRALGPALIELSGAQELGGRGTALRGQMLAQFGRTYLNAEAVKLWSGYRSDRIQQNVTGLYSLSADHTLALGRTYVPVSLGARYTTRNDGIDRLEGLFRASAGFGRINLTSELAYEQQRRRFGPDPPANFIANFLASGRIGSVRLRGESRFRLAPDSRFESATLVGEWSAGRGLLGRENDWRAEIGYDRPLRRARAGLGYVRRFEKFALNASVEAGSDGSFGAGLSLAFSLGPDPRKNGGIRITSERMAANGQVLANVFRDSNGDGVRQAGEPLEKEVQLAAGRVPVAQLTDARGQTVIDGLDPYQAVLIGIDASSLADPLVQPATPGIVVVPRPGIAIAVDLPLVSAGEVDGTLVRSGGGSLEGVDLELVDVEGRVVRRARSDFDGFFLFEGVPYGQYSVRVAKLAADAVRLSVEALGVAHVGDKSPLAHMGVVAARPRERRVQSGADPPR